MLCKLAWGNVRRAGRDYLVYLLTLTLAVTVFYAFNTISVQVDLAGVTAQNAGMGETLGGIISGLTVFLAVVMGFLMVYANNFIMKRRKKEFGLYQVLGMSKGQVARIMTFETLFVSMAALALGIVCGLALSQLMVFFLAVQDADRRLPLLLLARCLRDDRGLLGGDLLRHACVQPARGGARQDHRPHERRTAKRGDQDP